MFCRLVIHCVMIVTVGLSLMVPAASLAQDNAKTKLDEDPFADRTLGALFNKRVLNELELVDDQKADLKALMSDINNLKVEMGKSLRLFAKGASKSEIESKRKELVKQFENHKKQIQEAMYEVLLPHQTQRLGQVTAQLMLRETAKKSVSGVLSPEMKQFLEIDDEQAERIRKKAIELRKKLAEDMKKLNDKAIADLMKELTEKQRKKYKKLIGDPIKK